MWVDFVEWWALLGVAGQLLKWGGSQMSVNFFLGAPSASLEKTRPVPCLGGREARCVPVASTLELHPPVFIPLLFTLPTWALESRVSPVTFLQRAHTWSPMGHGVGGDPLTLFSAAPCSCLHDAFLRLFGLPGVPWVGLACLLFGCPLAGTYIGASSALRFSYYPCHRSIFHASSHLRKLNLFILITPIVLEWNTPGYLI